MNDPMDYYEQFGDCELSASDSLSEPCGLIQINDGNMYACGYLTPIEMRGLSSALVKLAGMLDSYNAEQGCGAVKKINKRKAKK